MTLSIQQLARTIAKARHGTDAMWANYVPSARAVVREIVDLDWRLDHDETMSQLRLLAQPDGAQ